MLKDIRLHYKPVGETDDKQFETRRLEQQILIFFAEIAETGNLFSKRLDNVDARCQ